MDLIDIWIKEYLIHLKALIKKQILTEFRFHIIPKYLKNPRSKILDVGCGNYSIRHAKSQYPNCQYHGLDLSKEFYSSTDLRLMDKFYEIDLNNFEYNEISNNHFDLIIFSHVLEHLPKGEKVLLNLMPKLKKNGVIYIEYPSIRSTKLPHKKGTLNFYDDKSHIRIYNNESISYILEKRGFKILRKGSRRDFRKIFALPLLIIYDLLKFHDIQAGHLWDLFGFADFIIAIKTT